MTTAPRDPPTSLRLGAERVEKIDAHAARRGLKRHAAILELIDWGLAAPVLDRAVVVAEEVSPGFYMPQPGMQSTSGDANAPSRKKSLLEAAEAAAAHLGLRKPGPPKVRQVGALLPSSDEATGFERDTTTRPRNIYAGPPAKLDTSMVQVGPEKRPLGSMLKGPKTPKKGDRR